MASEARNEERVLIKAPRAFKTPNEIVDDVEMWKNLKPSAAKLYMTLIRLTWGWQYLWVRMTVPELAAKTGLSERTVLSATKELEKNGLIEVTRVKRGRVNDVNIYTICADPETGKLTKAKQGGTAKFSPRVPQNSQSLNNSHSGNHRRKTQAEPAPSYDEQRLRTDGERWLFKRWMQVLRDSRHMPTDPEAVSMHLDDLDKLRADGVNIEKKLRDCVQNAYPVARKSKRPWVDGNRRKERPKIKSPEIPSVPFKDESDGPKGLVWNQAKCNFDRPEEDRAAIKAMFAGARAEGILTQ